MGNLPPALQHLPEPQKPHLLATSLTSVKVNYYYLLSLPSGSITEYFKQPYVIFIRLQFYLEQRNPILHQCSVEDLMNRFCETVTISARILELPSFQSQITLSSPLPPKFFGMQELANPISKKK